MSSCCSEDKKRNKKKKNSARDEKMPKSFIGKYLYKLGKEDAEKSKQRKGDCC